LLTDGPSFTFARHPAQKNAMTAALIYRSKFNVALVS